ncbi:hypothetical protein RN001_010798 [Aquatica leii]|uniref:Scavenger receptor class B member 1 n=1 Tax=Aquatica leii TaxID=1421715 RepID=A0AAN7P736_9COLE|nr:hypothetical protein RN001_010798 [Aquatica leii]
MLVEQIVEIRPNSFAFYLWKDPPYEVFGKLYLFNVTNGEKFLNGEEKLSFNEVGPYTYREVLSNTNVNFEKNGTLSFIPRRKIAFVPELSVGDPATDTLLLLNVPFLGIMSSINDYSMLIKMAMAQITFAVDSQPLVTLSVDQYMFGYEDVLVSLANNVLPVWIDFSHFGIVDRLMALDNGSTTMNMPVNTELTKLRNGTLTSIEKLNGLSGLVQWGYDPESDSNSKCNTISNYFAGVVFPPNFSKNASFVLYRHGFCRPLPISFNHSDSKYGFDAYTYRIDHDFLATKEENPNNHCFCLKQKCLPKGVGDLSPCYYNIPVALSQPHFLNADPITREQINGMHPDPAKHNFQIMINPQSGIPLEANLRLQINLHVTETKFNYRTKPFNELILPLFWVDLSVSGPPAIIQIGLYTLYVVLPNVQMAVLYILTFLSAVFVVGSVFTFVGLYVYQYRRYMEINYNEIEAFALK